MTMQTSEVQMEARRPASTALSCRSAAKATPCGLLASVLDSLSGLRWNVSRITVETVVPVGLPTLIAVASNASAQQPV